MCLSLESYENRMWKNYPRLRHFLSGKEAHPKHDRFSTATSITDTNFDMEKRFQDVLALIRSYKAELPDGPFSPVPSKPEGKLMRMDFGGDLMNAASDAEGWAEWHKHEADRLQSAARELRDIGSKMFEWQVRERQT
jgi:hypothetical protein